MTDLEGAVERLTAICKNLEAAPVVLIEAIYAAYPETPLIGVAVHHDLRTILDALASITRERDAMREAGQLTLGFLKPINAAFTEDEHEDRIQTSSGEIVTGEAAEIFCEIGRGAKLLAERVAAALVNGEGGE